LWGSCHLEDSVKMNMKMSRGLFKLESIHTLDFYNVKKSEQCLVSLKLKC